jgi:putative ABC transport system permease protein
MPKLTNTPPIFFTKLFQRFCKAEIFDELQGDLEEDYYLNTGEFGQSKAKRIYRNEVLRMVRPSILKSFKHKTQFNNTAMFRNYTKVAFRNLSKNKLFSFINITGLAIGMSVALLIINLVYDVNKFDEFHQDSDKIFRVISNPKFTGLTQNDTEAATAPLPLGELMKAELPIVDEVVRIRNAYEPLMKMGDNFIRIKGLYADPSFFNIFTFPFLQGNANSALKDPFTMVITKQLADRIFPNIDPINKVISLTDKGEFKVTGVLEDIPQHSHMQFEFITSISTAKALEESEKISETTTHWDNFNSGYVYFKTKDITNLETIQYWLDQTNENEVARFENLTNNYEIQSLTSIVPGKNLNNQIGAEFLVMPIVILAAIAFAIVLSASFNYTNLSIARALRRSREVGVRKVVGSSRRQIFNQFIVETFLITTMAVIASYFIFLLIKPAFVSLIPRMDHIISPSTPPILLLYFFGFALFIAFVSGVLPALFFSRISPLNALRNTSNIKIFSHINIRKSLIVIQFAFSLIFITSLSVITKQYNFFLNHDMGFDQENKMYVNLGIGNDKQLLINEFSKFPEVLDISVSSVMPGTGANQRTIIKNLATNDSSYIHFMSVDHNYMPMHNIDIIAGSNFAERTADAIEDGILVNETFTKRYGFETPEDALGTVYKTGTMVTKIIGVTSDFNYTNLEEPIESFVIRQQPYYYNYLVLNIKSNDIRGTLDKLEQKWYALDKVNDFNARFLDDTIESGYSFFSDIYKLFSFVGFITISIACLGLLGMAVFNAETRIKEIGVRKALGARAKQVFYILSKGFIKQLILASLIGAPLTYLLFDQIILAQFFYRVKVSPIELFTGIFILFAIAAVTIGAQTWRAARANPVDSLRHE